MPSGLSRMFEESGIASRTSKPRWKTSSGASTQPAEEAVVSEGGDQGPVVVEEEGAMGLVAGEVEGETGQGTGVCVCGLDEVAAYP